MSSTPTGTTSNLGHSELKGQQGYSIKSADRDWSRWMEENKTSLVTAFVVLLVAVLGGGYLYNSRHQSKKEFNAQIFTYEQASFEAFRKDFDANKLVLGFKALKAKTGSYIGIVPAAIKTSDLLNTHNKKAEALEVITLAKDSANNDYAEYFLNTRMAALYEDLGKNQQAVDVLTSISKSKVDAFPGKTYLDLGRIYLKLNEKEKAKASFQYVLDKAKDDAEFVKMAKLYLSNL
jgi:predicted negative regulator of RcsB-dependent stress response